MNVVEVGAVYMKEMGKYYRVLSVTKTHVYLRALRIGHHFNITLEQLEREYALVPRK